MAKQAGDIFIEGTLDNLTFYKMDGKHYVRLKSSLTAKKFWKSKAFERSRQSCKRFAEGNKLASKLYRTIEEEKRIYELFCFLKKRAIQLLKEGNSLVKTEEVLTDYLKTFGFMEETNSIIELPFTNICNQHDTNALKFNGDRERSVCSFDSTAFYSKAAYISVLTLDST